MKTIKLRHQGALVGPVPTLDTIDSARLGDMASAELELALGGMLDADDLAKVKAILLKYVGRSGTVNGLGAATADARSKCLAQIEHTKMVAAGYRDFWDKQNAELAASITR